MVPSSSPVLFDFFFTPFHSSPFFDTSPQTQSYRLLQEERCVTSTSSSYKVKGNNITAAGCVGEGERLCRSKGNPLGNCSEDRQRVKEVERFLIVDDRGANDLGNKLEERNECLMRGMGERKRKRERERARVRVKGWNGEQVDLVTVQVKYYCSFVWLTHRRCDFVPMSLFPTHSAPFLTTPIMTN
jgi:hypothetical protein